MRQYCLIKEQHKDALLFFRLGDFYELFFDDAKVASKELDITLTGRDCGMDDRAPMCGVPFHAADSYIAKLINKGYKVAICEQIQDPKEAKGLVDREVVRIITPGTVTEPSALDEKRNNYLASLYSKGNAFALAAADITTGEFYVSEFEGKRCEYMLLNELGKLSPSETIISENLKGNSIILDYLDNIASTSVYHDWAYDLRTAYQKLTNYFSVHSLDGFGCESLKCAISAAGALLEYITQTQKDALKNINCIKTHYPQEYMMLDQNALKNLELTENSREKGRKNSLLWLLDKTNTAFGARMLRRWLLQPLSDVKGIKARLLGVKEIMHYGELMNELKEALSQVYDLERLSGKISCKTANARDLIALKNSLRLVPTIKSLLQNTDSSILQSCWADIDPLDDVYELINRSIMEEPSPSLKEGNIIKSGYSTELDTLRSAMTYGRDWISAFEQKEKEKTGIRNLKAGFNKVFGYYLEVTKSYYDQVPDYFIRKQTLANCERFITDELKEVEASILGAEEKSVKLEYDIFINLRDEISIHIPRIQKTAQSIAVVDVLRSFAKTAHENNYVCPEVTDDDEIHIVNGRHPLVENMMHHNLFVPNDTHLNNREDQIMIITGPNMAGKSTYLRQVALITIMAQIGSFVPADRALIGIVDRIFTRIGASDDLTSGQSTFMVEMNEVANILHNATSKSLLILDEIGRGTSTFDGLSIAWAVIEHISKQKTLRAKTLFATHYHELTELEGKLTGVKNYCISVREQGDDIILLRKIIRGGADKSFGIQVAKLAGLPELVIKRASDILKKLEEADINNLNRIKRKKSTEQLSIFEIKRSAIEEELAKIDVYSMTPIEAMNLLYSLSIKAKSGLERVKNIDSGTGLVFDKSDSGRRSY
jgi:DNA mismatch repair protein MutS